MPSTWFTSDLHLDHANIIRYCGRPFQDVDEMNVRLIRYWNDRVAPSDTVYFLGDFAFTTRARMAILRNALHGHIVVIRGNHDRGPNALRECGFNEVYNSLYIEVDGLGLYLRHIPDLTLEWMKGRYVLHLCGHVHEKWKYHGPIINVGVDQWDFQPRELKELVAGVPRPFNPPVLPE